MAICTIQVTNVSPKASYQNVKELFSYFGGIDELKVYPEDEERKDIPSRVCFIAFKERSSLEAALHLTNTLFIDRALIVSQSRYEVIPEEGTAMSLATPAIPATLADPLLNPPTGPLLPTPQAPSLLGTPSQPLLQNPIVAAIQQAQSVASSINANIQGDMDGNVLNSSGFVPSQPNISGNVDPTKIDEIRRTIYVGNLNSTLTADQVMNFFQACGEIKYVRMAGDETQPARFAFVEFTNPESVQIALQYNGAMFGDRPVKVNHSKNAIVKPQGKTPEMAQREVDEAMRKVREATQVIQTSIEPPKGSRSRTRSRSRDRRKSRDDRRRRHSGSPSNDRHRRRSRSRSPYRFRRSPSPRRRDYGRHRRDRRSFSRSPDRFRNRRRTPERRRAKSRSRTRSPSPSRHRRRRASRDKERRRKRSPTRSPSPVRRKSKKSKKDKKRKKTPSLSPSRKCSPSLSPPPDKQSPSPSPKKPTPSPTAGVAGDSPEGHCSASDSGQESSVENNRHSSPQSD